MSKLPIVGTHEYYGTVYEVSFEARQERCKNWIEVPGFGTGSAEVSHADWFALYEIMLAQDPNPSKWCRAYHVFAKTPDGRYGHIGMLEYFPPGANSNYPKGKLQLIG